MLITTLRADRISAMKAKDTIAKGILTFLLGELEGHAKRVGSDITDEMVVQSCKKCIQSNNETIAVADDPARIAVLQTENELLSTFLPVQLSEDKLRTIIVDMNAKHIGEVMNTLKTTYNGQYDGKLASKLAKEIV